MYRTFKRFIRDENGATAIEYGLIASLIGVALTVSLQELGQTLSSMFENIGRALDNVSARMR
jgi:pilus assembly protein Flp/PilA